MTILTIAIENQSKYLSNLISITNIPKSADFGMFDTFFHFKNRHNLKKIDECWLIIPNGWFDSAELKRISEDFGIKIKLFRCKNVGKTYSQGNRGIIKSFVFRVVLNAREEADTLYLSSDDSLLLSDMQDAADIFDCDSLYFLDKKTLNPLMIKDKCLSNIIFVNDNEICVDYFPLSDAGKYNAGYEIFEESLPSVRVFNLEEDGLLLDRIEYRKRQMFNLYSNYYGMVKRSRIEREVFRKLYYLPGSIIEKLKRYKLGENPAKDFWIIKHLPKVELHSHIGGLLSPFEIIQVAQKARNCIADADTGYSLEFKKSLETILEYENRPKDFENLIYGKLTNKNNFKSIGIDLYQELGDFQGSSILQLKETIEATLDIYAKHLIEENVRYVEIRCSPYKYTKLGLKVKEVIEIIFKALDKYSLCFDYRLIYIIGRQAKLSEIEGVIKDYCELYDNNPGFKKKFVGIDVAGNEGATKPSELRGLFMPLLGKCAKITIHAGETESVDSIWEAVYYLSADRIGHGLNLKDKPELLARFVDKKIGVEMCPSSNYQIVGFEKGGYPLLDYMKAGLRVTLNTDDCGISRTTLTNEFMKAAEMCPGLTLWDCIVLIRNSLCIAFCDEKTREELMHSYEDEMLELFTEIFGD